MFPDGELIDVGESVLAMERAGFEVRDVESLREHYARTLRAWVANLEAAWDEAVRLVGEARARVWRLYMAGSAIGFTDDGIAIHQVLGVVPTADGASGMPATRRSFEATELDAALAQRPMIAATDAESRYSSRRVMRPSRIVVTMHAGTSTRLPARFVATRTCCWTKPSSVADRLTSV